MKTERPRVIVEANCANSTRISIGENDSDDNYRIEIIATENNATGLELTVYAKGKKVEIIQ